MRHTTTRDDILPVILGGDMSAYPLARAFHEAFGVSSVSVCPAPIAIIERSRFIDIHHVEGMDEEHLLASLTQLAHENPRKRLILMANYDAAVERVATIAPDLPEGVTFALPPHDVVRRASNKVTFAELCREHGLDAPRSQVVRLAGADAIEPATLGFPLIAKPAVSSAEFFNLFQKGFKKVYFVQGQGELDRLWADLRAEGFGGDFLVQELIGGDDTFVDMITVYVNQRGKTTLFVSAQVLLEDHAPTLFGNPVAMITRPMPQLWEKVDGMLSAIGWRGFANFDMKRDPRTGRVVFMDFNPRIGNNSYYACVGGANPMRALVADLVDGTDEVLRASEKGLYTRARPGLVRRYLTDPELAAEFDGLVRARRVGNPMRYPADTLRARFVGKAMELNYDRKFARHYPRPTSTSF